MDEVLAKKFVLNWLRYAVEVVGSLNSERLELLA